MLISEAIQIAQASGQQIKREHEGTSRVLHVEENGRICEISNYGANRYWYPDAEDLTATDWIPTDDMPEWWVKKQVAMEKEREAMRLDNERHRRRWDIAGTIISIFVSIAATVYSLYKFRGGC